MTRCGHHAKKYTVTPEYWHRRKSGQFDKFFYRYATSSKDEYRVSTTHWSMDHQLDCTSGSKILKLIPGPLRTQEKPSFERSDFDIRDHNLKDWCIYIDRENLWDASPLTRAKPRSKYEFVGCHPTLPVLRYRVLPCRCPSCLTTLVSPQSSSRDCHCRRILDLNETQTSLITVNERTVIRRMSTRRSLVEQADKRRKQLTDISKRLRQRVPVVCALGTDPSLWNERDGNPFWLANVLSVHQARKKKKIGRGREHYFIKKGDWYVNLVYYEQIDSDTSLQFRVGHTEGCDIV